MSARTATLIGATGLIGGELLKLLLEDKYFDSVRILIRKPFAMEHPKLEKKLVDFADADSLLVALDGSDVIFVAVGTTQKKVKGDKQAYRKVDHDIPVNIARYGKMVGCKNLVLVSSAGADSKRNNFYLKLKGEVEDAIKEIGIESVHIMRPSMLLGKRSEFRRGEKTVQAVMKVFSFLLPSKYKPIEAKDVANAMFRASKKNENARPSALAGTVGDGPMSGGFFIWEYTEMKKLS